MLLLLIERLLLLRKLLLLLFKGNFVSIEALAIRLDALNIGALGGQLLLILVFITGQLLRLRARFF